MLIGGQLSDCLPIFCIGSRKMIENLSDRIFEPAEVSFKQDINYVLNESVYACTFKPTKESSLLYVDSQKYFSDKHEADKNAKKSCGLILLLIGVFVLCSICKILYIY